MPGYKFLIKFLILPLLVCFALQTSVNSLKAQEMWGITSSNFAGSSGTLLNPTSIITSKLYMDINLVTFNFFADNNYAYIHKEDFKLSNFLSSDPVFPEYGPDNMAFDYYKNTELKTGYVSVLIKGPSFFMSKGKHAYGFHTGIRSLTSVNRLPHEIANYAYFGLDFTDQQNVDYNDYDFLGNSLALTEIGLTYAYAFRQFNLSDWSAGVTLKGLFGYAGGYAYANNFDYIVLNDSSINIRNLNMEAGYSLPVNYENNEYPDGNGYVRGIGLGLDVGVTYQRKERTYQKRRYDKLCSQRFINYKYKVGVSIIDFGLVNFNKNTQVHSFEDVSKYWVNVDTLSFYNVDQLVDDFNIAFYGSAGHSFVSSSMKFWLPTALSLQLDYHIYRRWYVAANLIQPLIISKSQLVRPAQVVLAPRYEFSKIEVSLPISLYNYKQPKVGAAVRIYFLTIGTDNFLSLAGLSDFTGMDVYFSVKFNFLRGKCGKSRRFVPCQNGEYGIQRK